MKTISKLFIFLSKFVYHRREKSYKRKISENPDRYSLVLCFHDVSNNTDSKFSISKGELELILQKIRDNVIRIDELDIKKGFVVTFDDGYKSIFTEVYPLCKKLHVPFVAYIITDFIGRPGYLSEDEIGQLSRDREICTFGSHMCSHKKTRELSRAEIKNEWINSKRALEAITKENIVYGALPYGSIDSCTKKSVSIGIRAGYRNIATTQALPYMKAKSVGRFVYQNDKEYII